MMIDVIHRKIERHSNGEEGNWFHENILLENWIGTKIKFCEDRWLAIFLLFIYLQEFMPI